MIRSPLGIRLVADPDRLLRDQLREAAQFGARGVVLDANGDLNPNRLSETGRRDLRHTFRSIELKLDAINLPTRAPFDSFEQLDERVNRAGAAFAMGFDLGARVALVRVGKVPPESSADRRGAFEQSLIELGRRASHHGLQLAILTGPDDGESLKGYLENGPESFEEVSVSLDPGELLRHGHDPVTATKALGFRLVHAFARDGTFEGSRERTIAPHPRGTGFDRGVLDWEEYLGALEEVNYAGPLTIWPDPDRPIGPQFRELADRFDAF